MGKHAQSRSRYTAWSHSRLFPARESGGGCRTEVGGSLCNRLPVWHAVFLCQLHLVSRQRPVAEGIASQIRSRGYLSAHCGDVHSVYTARHEHAGGWGWGIFSFVWLSAIVGFILSFKKTERTQ